MRMQKGEAHNHLLLGDFELRFDLRPNSEYDYSVVYKPNGLKMSWRGYNGNTKYLIISRIVDILQSLGYRTYSNFNDYLYRNVDKIYEEENESRYRRKKP